MLRTGSHQQRWKRNCTPCLLPTRSSSAVLQEATPSPSYTGLKTTGLSAKRTAWEGIRWEKQSYITLFIRNVNALPCFTLLRLVPKPFCHCGYNPNRSSTDTSFFFFTLDWRHIEEMTTWVPLWKWNCSSMASPGYFVEPLFFLKMLPNPRQLAT